MYMNLHNLPAGQSMYTLYVTEDPEGTPRSEVQAEEIDVVASSSAKWEDVVGVGSGDIHELFGEGNDARVVGVVNQSDAYVMYDAWK